MLTVTTLNDDGTGLLRAALESDRPRVIVFETSGNIDLQEDIIVREPCVTLAGQTAPSRASRSGTSGFVVHPRRADAAHAHQAGGWPAEAPADRSPRRLDLYTPDAYNIVFDHNSLSWAQGKNTDVFSVAEHAGITFWRNIISESLYRAQNVIIDRGQPSSLGMLVSQFYSQEAANVSILGNLFAHNSARNPEIQGPVNVHFINNVVYDWGKDATNYQWATFIYGAGASAPPKVAVIGNTYIAGPGPLPFKPLYAIGACNAPAGTKIYLSDNALDDRAQPWGVAEYFTNGADHRVSSSPVSLSGITVRPSSSVESFVLANAGARPADRDSVDGRIITEVTARIGTVIDSQVDVGGWPVLAVNTRHLTPPDSPHADPDRDGYTNLEEWLHTFSAVLETGQGGEPSITVARDKHRGKRGGKK